MNKTFIKLNSSPSIPWDGNISGITKREVVASLGIFGDGNISERKGRG